MKPPTRYETAVAGMRAVNALMAWLIIAALAGWFLLGQAGP